MDYLVALDAGHGGFGVTPGKRTPDGEYEWSFNNKVVLAATVVLEANGVKVLRVDDPTGKTDIGLTARTNKANQAKADVYVSVHHNANTGKWGEWTGTETFTYLGSNPGSEKLAGLVQPRLVKAMGLKDRGLKKANFAVVRQTKMPAILTEGGYMDSSIDIVKLRNDKVLVAAGVAIAEGVLAYFGITPKNNAPKPTPVSKPVTPATGIYRVRKTWADEKSQVGAFKDLESAKKLADKHKYYRVFNEKGVVVYQPEYEKAAPKPAPAPAKPKHVIPNVTLRSGSKGYQVILLQEALNAAGFKLKGKVDGAFGPDTLQALKRFQSVHANPADGIAGPGTRAALDRVLNK